MGWTTRLLAYAMAATTLVACAEEGAGGIASGTAQFRWNWAEPAMPLQSGVVFEETESGETLVALTSWPNATCAVDEWHEFTYDPALEMVLARGPIENPYTIVMFPAAPLGEERGIVMRGVDYSYGGYYAAFVGGDSVRSYLVEIERDAAGGARGRVGFRSTEIPTSSPGARPTEAVDYPEDSFDDRLVVEGAAWFDVPYCGRRHVWEYQEYLLR